MMLTASVEGVVAGRGRSVPRAHNRDPRALSVTGLLKPLVGVTVMLYVVLETFPPTERLAGVALNEKSGAGFTTSVAGAEWLNVPLTPLIVRGYVPVGVVVAVVTARVDEPAAGLGVNVPVGPLGRPST